jgi:hypothetical protein
VVSAVFYAPEVALVLALLAVCAGETPVEAE